MTWTFFYGQALCTQALCTVTLGHHRSHDPATPCIYFTGKTGSSRVGQGCSTGVCAGAGPGPGGARGLPGGWTSLKACPAAGLLLPAPLQCQGWAQTRAGQPGPHLMGSAGRLPCALGKPRQQECDRQQVPTEEENGSRPSGLWGYEVKGAGGRQG